MHHTRIRNARLTCIRWLNFCTILCSMWWSRRMKVQPFMSGISKQEKRLCISWMPTWLSQTSTMNIRSRSQRCVSTRLDDVWSPVLMTVRWPCGTLTTVIIFIVSMPMTRMQRRSPPYCMKMNVYSLLDGRDAFAFSIWANLRLFDRVSPIDMRLFRQVGCTIIRIHFFMGSSRWIRLVAYRRYSVDESSDEHPGYW